MLYSSVTYAMTKKPIGLGISSAVLLAGAISFIAYDRKHPKSREDRDETPV